MIFLEINEGLCIKKEDIIAIKKVKNNKSEICTIIGNFDCNFSYDEIKAILEMGNSNRLSTSNNGQYFAG